jgi:deoxyribonuclease-1
MESDLYNLIPAIWSINAQRSNYQVSEIQWEKYVFWKCDVEIDTENNTFEPPQNLKWDIARIYKYMDTTYSGRWIIGEQTKRIFEVWEKIDPISVEECNRYKAILKYQKNKNIVLHETCSKLN